jgi:tetratricopeptide (TPR) repeat protein
VKPLGASLLVASLGSGLVATAGAGAGAGAGFEARAAATPEGSLARLDRLHERRDQPAALEEARALCDAEVAAAPNDAERLWRAARVIFTQSEEPARAPAERSQLGKVAWDLAERALAIDPHSAAAHYWAALAIGSYAEGIGILKALASGIEGKFTRHLQRASELDPGYDHGNIPVVWAAYHLEVPWPKRDRKRAEAELAQALRMNPDSLRARLYLARVLFDTGRPAEARTRLGEIASAPVGRYDPPEERRVKREAIELGAELGLTETARPRGSARPGTARGP